MQIEDIGFGITMALGFLSLTFARQMASILGYGKNLSTLANIEFRATYGAFFLTLGALGLLLNNQAVSFLIGSCWFSAGLVRALCFLKSQEDVKENVAGLVIELGVATFILFDNSVVLSVVETSLGF
jgi:hypothetical protein